MPMVSVILPHYKNNDPFLEECVDSILKQTFDDFELILIDNSRGFKSLLAEKLADKDPRIVYLYREGIGKCGARNLGIDLSKGNFLCFVDSDDFLKSSYLEALISAFSLFPGATIAFGEGERYDEEGNLLSSFSYNDGECKLIEMTPEFAFRSAGAIGPWEHLIRKDAIGALRFDETIQTMEDRLFFLELYLGQPTIVNVRLPIYCYRVTSIASTSFKGVEWLSEHDLVRLYASIRIFELLRDKTKDRALKKKALRSAEASCLSYYCGMYSFRHAIAKKADDYRKQIICNSRLERPLSDVLMRVALQFPRPFYFAMGKWLFSEKARQRRAK